MMGKHYVHISRAKVIAFLGVVFLGLCTLRLSAQFSYTETFMNDTAEGWVLGSESGSYTPELTAASGVDTDGDGWLRLTTAGGNQSNYAYLDNSFSSANNDITVSFEFTSWGGSGADGISFFIFDTDVVDANGGFQTGSYGGSLGYANRTGDDGLLGGYVGVGIDEYGNFSNETEGRNGGTGFDANEIVVRGPDTGSAGGQDGFDYLASTGGYDYTDSGDATTLDAGDAAVDSLGVDLDFSSRPETGTSTEYNKYGLQVNLSIDDILTVSFDEDASDGIGQWVDILEVDMSSFDRPDNMSIGFTASTGGLTNYHELRGLEILTTAQPVTNYLWDNDSGDSLWTTATNWESDVVPPVEYDVFFEDTYVSAAQVIDLNGNQTVRSISFDAPFSYTLNNDILNFDNSTNPGYLQINVSEVNGTASHTINSDIDIADDLTVSNYGTGSSVLTLGGDIALNANDMTVTGPGSTDITGLITGSGKLIKSGDGTTTLSLLDRSFTGGTDVLNGSLVVDGSSVVKHVNFGSTTQGQKALGTGDVYVAGGGDLNVTSNAAKHIRFYGGNITVEGTATFDAGQDIVFRDGSNFDIDGGSVTWIATDDIRASNTGNSINVTNGGTALAQTTAGNTNSKLSLNAASDVTVSGSGSTFTYEGTNAELRGNLLLEDGGIFYSDATSVTVLDSTLSLDGGTVGDKGTLVVTDDLRINTTSMVNSPNITIDSTDAVSVYSSNNTNVSGIGDFTIRGGGDVTLEDTLGAFGANNIIIEAGTLIMSENNLINDTTNLTLTGGSLNTGGFDDTLGSLTLSSGSHIDLSSGSDSKINFADSSSQSWSSGETLYIDNWSGTPTTGGGSEGIYFGNSSSGLTQGQLDQIVFVMADGNYTAKILSSGEIVPYMLITAVPEPSTWIAIGGLFSLIFWRERKRLHFFRNRS